MAQYSKRKLGATSLLLVVSASLLSSIAQVTQVVLGAPVATTDGGMAMAVTLAPGSQAAVAAVQFDLQYDASRYGFTQVAAGDAAAAAGKDAMVSEPAPGVVRVIVAGINQETLESGTVATLYFQPTGKAGASSSLAMDSSLTEVVVSDPFGGKNDAVVASAGTPSNDTSSGSHESNDASAASSQASGNQTGTSLASANSVVNAASGSTSSQQSQTTSKLVVGTNDTSASVRNPGNVVSAATGVLADEMPIRTDQAELPRMDRTARQASASEQSAPVASEPSPAAASAAPPQPRPVSPEHVRTSVHEPVAATHSSEAARLQIAKNVPVPSRPESLATGQAARRDGPTGFISGSARNAMIGGVAVVVFLVLGMWVLKRT